MPWLLWIIDVVRPRRRYGLLLGRRLPSMLKAGQSWSAIQAATGCSRATVAKIAKRQPKAA